MSKIVLMLGGNDQVACIVIKVDFEEKNMAAKVKTKPFEILKYHVGERNSLFQNFSMLRGAGASAQIFLVVKGFNLNSYRGCHLS